MRRVFAERWVPCRSRPRTLVFLALAVALAAAACAPAAGAPPGAPPPAGAATAGQSASGSPSGPTAANGPNSSSASAPSPLALGGPGGAGPPEHLAFAATPSVGSAGVYVGIERGYFREVGLDVEVVPFTGAASMISSIAASQVDAANSDAGSGLLNAIGRDLPMRFVADGSRCMAGLCHVSFLVRKGLADAGGFKDLADLRGKRLNSFTPGSTMHQYISRVLDMAGLAEADVSFQNIQFGDVLPAFGNAALDASFQIEPYTTAALEQGFAVRWASLVDLLGPRQSTVIVYAPAFAAQRPEAGRRFLVGYLRGIRDYLDAFQGGKDLDGVIAVLTANTAVHDAALYKRMTVPGFDPNGEILIDDLKENQQWWVERGAIPTPVDLDRIYDHTYLDYALGVVGRR